MRIFLTGAAGFIGFHSALTFLKRGDVVCGYDSVNDYYDPAVKQSRLETLYKNKNFTFKKGLLEDLPLLKTTWEDFKPTHVLHLAAQAGVRYSIENPMAYINSNIVGFQHMIDLAKKNRPENFVYASSSSVYGGNKTLPFSEDQDVSNPISLYAATKISNELTATCYGNLFGIKSTGLRFFTVYGPFSRPDMAMFKFAELMRQAKSIPVFNNGKMIRDFTYVDDIVGGIAGALEKPELNQVYNLGKGNSNNLMEMIELLQKHLGIKAKMDMMPMQQGDVEATLADVSKAKKGIGFNPKTDLATGVANFAAWYKEYRKI